MQIYNCKLIFQLLNYLGPVPDHIRAYIASLDYNADVALLRRNVGT